MTETRAPFNGKKKELFLIQLPMSAENVMTVRKHIMSQCVTNDAIVNGIRAIGMPATGSKMDYEATVAHYEAKLAERDAEISRLWAALDSIECGIDALPADNEYGSRISAHQMQWQAVDLVKEEIKALKGGGA
ncbi:hypothetical protein [Acetobacter pasteurianus]|uniref:Uncharacterized protein n=1 Tax=Acetobacter pasteurianus NBRC 3188 TaxID=1226663 RepID=A0A401WUV7_ACEPA|nr:hypothetical protein [Acetobacter pasteurianus]GCD53076.1 hypothetical protein NBRC3188_1773 [Acetobacter pasteurianus NBRC 3188]